MAIVDSAGAELIQPTQEVSALAADASRQVGRVSDDAEEARSNVATAESSAEQLTAETNHIGQQIQATAQAARNAMQQVSATNAVGTGPQSAASNAVTPCLVLC